MNKSEMVNFASEATSKTQKSTVVLSAKDFVIQDNEFIDAVVLFNEDVMFELKDLEIVREYDSLNAQYDSFSSLL